MFQQRLAGHSVASIARHLNERDVPCPSSADPDRNRHRTRVAWTLRTVAVILANRTVFATDDLRRDTGSRSALGRAPAQGGRKRNPATLGVVP
ncbi:recombinase family protein [Amycolatopsis sp. lyj-109]|uniref:recombinase family protein n=1 Tax=Amycolatopsis sp. lyj-109 TaxID=2789287 RepID=UPI003979A83A